MNGVKRGNMIQNMNFNELPKVTLSFAMSLDGKIATRTGDSKYISGSESLAFVHGLRNQHDGILVGIQTVLIDDPTLTTRFIKTDKKDAERIILDSTLKIPLFAKILHLDSSANTHIFTLASSSKEKIKALKNLSIKVYTAKEKDGRLDLHDVLKQLKRANIHSVLVEGGSTVHASFITENLFDEIYATIAPIIIGGTEAKTPVGGKGFSTLIESRKLQFLKTIPAGNDLIIHAKNIYKEGENK